MASHFTNIFHRCSRKTLSKLQLLKQNVRQLFDLNPSGGNFCSGYDLKEVAKGNFYGIASEHGPMGPTKKLLKKPVVASVNGYAVAGGFELALWCDLRVVEETAVMGFFNRRFGVPLVNGSTVRLPQLIGLSRALDLILTGRPVSAKEAFEMGIATKITACGTGEYDMLWKILHFEKFNYCKICIV
ncbi:UNVERIFIED_CONTAM: yngF [Trichonephila clavipes]